MAGCEQNLFLTFEQVNGLGGRVKAKAKGHTVVRWDKPKDTARQSGSGAASGDGQRNVMKLYTVFNIEQCDIPEPAMQALAKPQAPLPAEIIVKGMPNCPKIVYEDGDVHYDVVEDTVHIQKLKSKKNAPMHYASLLHLLVHSTGNDSRLARNGVAEMGELVDAPLYSKEELVASIGTRFLLARAGLTLGYPSNAQYIQAWIEKLQGDKWLVFKAASEAQKAFDYILDIKDGKNKNGGNK